MLLKIKLSCMGLALIGLFSCSLFDTEEQTIPDVMIVYDVLNEGTSRYDYDLRLSDLSGERDRALLEDSFNDVEPQFNADGDGVYFISNAGSYYRELFYVDTSSNGRTAITDEVYVQSFDVSPVGDRVAYASSSSGISSVFIYDGDAGTSIRLCDGRDPVFVDNGNAVILLGYHNEYNLRKVSIGNTDTLEISTDANNSQIICFSEDRKVFVVYSKPDYLNSFSYYLMNNAGGFLATLTFGAGNYGDPALSRDGSTLTYASYSQATSALEIFIDIVGTGLPRQVTLQGLRAKNPIFVDADNFILYTQEEGSQSSLYVVSSDGKQIIKVTPTFGSTIQNYDVVEF